ncbi:hypothetical protein FGO68_gene9643 [Halteria grandinella]|uniref:Uncharacterized protein n=1 Tax=Halteria grandinella TaxID=5974 RepID=A0A8J8NU47_HALGN|nr:hypothetical protein FGO68_gene9643 [Halteria grandinella]
MELSIVKGFMIQCLASLNVSKACSISAVNDSTSNLSLARLIPFFVIAYTILQNPCKSSQLKKRTVRMPPLRGRRYFRIYATYSK